MNAQVIEGKISDVIKRRYSCRTYDGRPIGRSVIADLEREIRDLGPAPFGTEVRFTIAAAGEGDSKDLRGLGTYGFIKKPSGFIIGAMKESSMNLEDYGYLMEKLVLAATSRGLASCWLGGSFTRSSFADRIACRDDETVPAVAALGYPAEKKRMVERVARWKMGADNRLPWEEVFFDGHAGSPLARESAGAYALPLEMLRLAPSAVNYQPWRIVREGDNYRYHFYLARTRRYDEKSFMVKSDLQRIDMGIAMAHFELAARETGLGGRWMVPEGSSVTADGLIHVATWAGNR